VEIVRQNEPLDVKGTLCLSPVLQGPIISTLTNDTEPRKPVLVRSKRLKARVSAAHDALTKVVEAMGDVRGSVDAVVKGFRFVVAGRGGVIDAPERVLSLISKLPLFHRLQTRIGPTRQCSWCIAEMVEIFVVVATAGSRTYPAPSGSSASQTGSAAPPAGGWARNGGSISKVFRTGPMSTM
jgi:hypothetical protein